LHSVRAFGERGSDEGFAAEAEADFEGLAMDFGFGAEGLADVAQLAACSAGYEVAAGVELVGSAPAERTYEIGSPAVPVHLAALAERGADPP